MSTQDPVDSGQQENHAVDPPVPAGTLALAVANLIQSSGASISIVEHVPDDPERPLVTKLDEVAAVQPDAPILVQIIHRIRGWESATIILGVVIAAAAGVFAAMGSLDTSGEQPVNIFWLLGAILGGQTLLLLAWLLLALVGGRLLRRFSIGGVIITTAGFIASKFTIGGDADGKTRRRRVGAAAAAIANADFGGSRARWALGTISHLAWTAFNSGLLVSLLAILSIQQFDFGWETTIGSDEFFEEAGEVISIAPNWVGFDVPTEDQLHAARIDPTTGTLADAGDPPRRAFSGLLIGSVVLYGLAPRIILFLACLGLWRRTRRRWRPDTDAARFAPLRRMTEPQAVRVGTQSVDRNDLSTDDEQLVPIEQRRTEGAAIVGIELDTPACGWPPPCGAPVEDLGILESREDRAAIARRLSIATTRPARLIAIADVATTPDRGISRSLEQIHQAAEEPKLQVVLTGGERFRARVDAKALERRTDDWHTLVDDLGISGKLHELDLDNLTATTRAKLSEIVGGAGRPELPRDRGILGAVDAAFAEIGAHARRWPGAPGDSERLALHKAVATCAGAETGIEIKGLPSAKELVENPRQAIEQAAGKMLALLPGKLVASTKWAAIGGTVGALACVAAAGTVAPAVLAALPVWMASGAASGGVISALRGTPDSAEAQVPEDEATLRGEVVAGAALHATVLALQGRGERFIQETLERVFNEEPPVLTHADEVGPALSRWRGRIAAVLGEQPDE